MASKNGDLLQGTLGLLILKALAGGERHGYGIARWIKEITGDILQIEEGSLYPALRVLGALRAQPPPAVLCDQSGRPAAPDRRRFRVDALRPRRHGGARSRAVRR